MYHLPRVCRTLVPEICVRPEMLRVIQYSDVLTCMIYNCMHSTEQHGRLELLVSAVNVIDEDRKVNAQTHGIDRFSLLRQWNCSCPATCQHACVNQKRLMGCQTVLLFCDIHIDKGATLNLLQRLRVCGCGAVQTNSVETPLALLHNIISSGLPPVFLECTSNYYLQHR